MPAVAIRIDKDTYIDKKNLETKNQILINLAMTSHSKLPLIYSTLCFLEPYV